MQYFNICVLKYKIIAMNFSKKKRNKNKTVCIVQPFLTSYRLPVFLELANLTSVDILFSLTPSNQGFIKLDLPQKKGVKFISTTLLKPFGEKFGLIQQGLMSYIIQEQPSSIIIFSNPRYFSFWITLIIGMIYKIDIYPQGHGLFKKQQVSLVKKFLYKIMYKIILFFSKSYLCYTDSVRQSFLDFGFSDKKLKVAENSIVNYFPITPQEKTGNEIGILFIGRLRIGCEINLLIKVIKQLYDENVNISLHIIGDGEEKTLIDIFESLPWMYYYGAISNQKKIAEISKKCMIGCHAGNAGLSVLHYMSLSLVPITHNNMSVHEGPEPSYIKNEENGVLLDFYNIETSLYQSLKDLLIAPKKAFKLRNNAYQTYINITNPSYAKRLYNAIK